MMNSQIYIGTKQLFDDIRITTIRIDQTYTDLEITITRIVDEGAIEEIRNNSHRYIGVKQFDTMFLRQLDDENSNQYVDGTAVTPQMGYDVWMRLPRFYYKCTQVSTDVWDFSVAYGGKPDDTYNTWSGNELIGAYEGYVEDEKMFSNGNSLTSTASLSQAQLKQYARNRGDGFTLVKWKHHCMMAMLFYTKYEYCDCQTLLGNGTANTTKVTGASNSYGMHDTQKQLTGNTSSINFWGLENWWGNKAEFIDNVTVDNGNVYVIEDDGAIRNPGKLPAIDGYVWTFLFGENIDLIATAIEPVTDATGFMDVAYYSVVGDNQIFSRSGLNNTAQSGVGYINTDYTPDTTSEYYGARLAYCGKIKIVDEFHDICAQIQYVETNATAYIDTGIIPTSNTRIVFHGYNLESSSGWTFGAVDSLSINQFAFSCIRSYNFRYGTQSKQITNVPVGELDVDFNGIQYRLNEIVGTFNTETFDCSHTVFLGAINYNGSVSNGKFIGRIFSCKIYDGSRLVRDYIPATNIYGVYGLYDKVQNKFYPSVSDEGFTGG